MNLRAPVFTGLTIALTTGISLVDPTGVVGEFGSIVIKVFLGYCTIITGNQMLYALHALQWKKDAVARDQQASHSVVYTASPEHV